MGVKYGGRLGRILEKYSGANHPNCPSCHTPQVQIVNYLRGDPEWRCRHCKHKFTLPFEDAD